MTILNIHRTPKRALIATNTAGIRFDGSQGISTKLFALLHANTLLCVQGQLALGFNVFADCMGAMTDFDGMAKVLEGSARAKFAAVQQEVKAAGVTVNLDTVIALVGWSTSRGAITFLQCSLSSANGVSVEEQDHDRLSPWQVERWGQPSLDISTEASMVALAKRQAEAFPSPQDSCGGDLILCEITPESLTFTSVKDFWK